MQQYIDWLKGDIHEDNPLRSFDISKFSCYIDYKYMKDMFKEQPDVLKVSLSWRSVCSLILLFSTGTLLLFSRKRLNDLKENFACLLN